jgi:hypothetical protein
VRENGEPIIVWVYRGVCLKQERRLSLYSREEVREDGIAEDSRRFGV